MAANHPTKAQPALGAQLQANRRIVAELHAMKAAMEAGDMPQASCTAKSSE